MATQPFTGYPGQVWATCWQAMSWLSGVLNGGAAPISSIAAGAAATFATLRNGAAAVAAYQTGAALNAESANLAAIQNMVLPLDPLTTAYVNARINATSAAASGISALPPTANPFAAVGLLTAGRPAIADPGFLEWCMAFAGETAPAALATSGVTACAAQESAAWLNTATTIQIVEGGTSRTDYRFDAAARVWRTANRVATMLGQMQSGAPQATYPNVWSSAVALPTILLDAASLCSAPSSLGTQQANVIRYVLDTLSIQLAQLLLSLRAPQGTTPGLATLRNGESLQDLAARTTGNFEDWQTIAAANGLGPPYPGQSNQAVALSGRQLLLPSASGSATATPGSPIATYFANVLGTDWDFGPINGAEAAWTGDIPLITGYLNFARALGRRLQTPLGTLIYHVNYGSRIPPEVGAIQSEDEAARLAQYGRSAIQQDPRTGEILSSSASTQPGFLATFSATVQPIGPGASPVSVNEVISPLP